MNSKLKGKKFPLTDQILNLLTSTFNTFKNENSLRGYNIVRNLIKNKFVSYENAKRIKGLLEQHNDNTFKILGGDKMLQFLNDLLNGKREAIKKNKEIRRMAGEENTFIKPHEKNFDNKGKVNIPRAFENIEKTIFIITEEQYKKIK